MKKQDAIDLFGSGAALARALGVTRQLIWAWPADLDEHQTDRVIGAAIRLGKLPGLIQAGIEAQRRESA
jgi:hypothetical protein